MTDSHRLRWDVSHTKIPSLPSHISRTLICDPQGRSLELLVASPSQTTGTSSHSRKQPLFFVHGGFGHAAVWIPYMTFFSQLHSIPCYAISLRGHGASWVPGFLRMWLLTSKDMLAEDVVTGLRYVKEKEEKLRTDGTAAEITLVGHSSGGGLAQLVLSKQLTRVRALILVGAIPCFGSRGVYWNWFKLDPWFMIRSLWHLQHPRSPLSSTTLVHRVFFCPEFPRAEVAEFESLMPEYESLNWPIGMLRPFINVRRVLAGISGWDSGERIMVVAGGLDRICSVPLMRRMAQQYRTAVGDLVKEKKIDETEGAVGDAEEAPVEKCTESRGAGVRFTIVEGAGHHVQNDLQRDDGARRILDFVKQLDGE